jgi:glycine/D-amino acid oxidase-like deaminating enzyme
VDISDPEHKKKRIEDMIQEAIKLAMLKDVQIVSIDGALRGTTSDFFPIVGPMIDTTQLKKRYPRMRDCLTLPLDKIPLIPNLWVCTGFGGR